MQAQYDPLHALYSLRFPSQTGTGSHDLYQHGQVTNRSATFLDHRNTVHYFYQIYNGVLNETEGVAWAADEQQAAGGPAMRLKGVPLVIRFHDTLNEPTFNRWVSLAFRKRNQFRLWGEPVRMGPTKVHVYGADRHLWQPINLEMTAHGLTAILPQGTCGNTFHRLVTNIQRFVCPQNRRLGRLTSICLPHRQTTHARNLSLPCAMNRDELIKDPIFQFNLLLWMARDQPEEIPARDAVVPPLGLSFPYGRSSPAIAAGHH
ncbi:MAG: hypothetical protein LBK99_25810 [Opitutaceae bacterium]|nr:hypothetical protein [Opitutaceae bacterium]